MSDMKTSLLKKFPWGPVVNTFEIGPYFIIEFHPRIYKDGHGTREFDKEITNFHPYVDWHDTNHTYMTMDQAIIGAICKKNDGYNSRADGYIFAMLGIQ